MTTSEQTVLATYPTARLVYCPDSGKFTIRHLVGGEQVALSAEHESASEAWYEVARTLVFREFQKRVAKEFQEGCAEAMVLDQIERLG